MTGKGSASYMDGCIVALVVSILIFICNLIIERYIDFNRNGYINLLVGIVSHPRSKIVSQGSRQPPYTYREFSL